MRKILFRGKTIKTRFGGGKWIEGFYAMSCAGRGEMEPAIITGTERSCFITEFVDPGTVGQFTGLCDDKGRKVFEGDIIDVRGRFKSEVRYISRNAGYLIKDNYGDWKWLYDVLASMPCEVIGNIHDNPELAKEESK